MDRGLYTFLLVFATCSPGEGFEGDEAIISLSRRGGGLTIVPPPNEWPVRWTFSKSMVFGSEAMTRVIDSGVAFSSNFVRPCSDGSETSRLNELYVS